MTLIKYLACRWHSINSSFSHCCCFPSWPCFSRHLDTPYRMQGSWSLWCYHPLPRWGSWGSEEVTWFGKGHKATGWRGLGPCVSPLLETSKSAEMTTPRASVGQMSTLIYVLQSRFRRPAPGKSQLQVPKAHAQPSENSTRVWFRFFGFFYFGF